MSDKNGVGSKTARSNADPRLCSTLQALRSAARRCLTVLVVAWMLLPLAMHLTATPASSMPPAGVTAVVGPDETYAAEQLIVADWGEGPGEIGYRPGGPERRAGGPSTLAVDDLGGVYVLDSVNDRVLIFDSDGVFSDEIPLGDSIGPIDLAVSPSGTDLFVLDSTNERLLKYNRGATLLGEMRATGVISQSTRVEMAMGAVVALEGIRGLEAHEPDLVTLSIGRTSESLPRDTGSLETRPGRATRQGPHSFDLRVLTDTYGLLTIAGSDGASVRMCRISTANPLAGAALLDFDAAGNAYVRVDTFAGSALSQPSIESAVYKIDSQGSPVTSFALPTDYHTVPYQALEVDASGGVYLLLPGRDNVKVIRWTQRDPESAGSPTSFAEANRRDGGKTVAGLAHPEYAGQRSGVASAQLSISRDTIIANAESYRQHSWYASGNNLYDRTCPNGVPVGGSPWGVGWDTGVAYAWGGYDSIGDYDWKLNNGYFVGDIVPIQVADCVAGVDCSGFVSRAWGESRYTTSTIYQISSEISSSDLQRGDILNKPGQHVVLFSYWDGGGQPVYYEATNNSPYKVWLNVHLGWSGVSGYTPRRYNGISSGDCPQSGGVILYWNRDYNCDNDKGDDGYRQRLTTGSDDISGEFNDDASSIRVPAGWSVMLYEHAGRSGGKKCFNSNDSNFEDNNFDNNVPLNDQVSSFEVFDHTDCSVPVDAAQHLAQSEYPTVQTGQQFSIWFEVRNTGNTTWRDSDGYGLENLNGTTLGAWGRQEIGADVPPGATKRWDIQMTAPATPGLYKTDWKLKHWSDEFGPYMFIDVTVVSPSVDAAQHLAQSEYPTVETGQQFSIWFEVRNTGNTTWRDSDGYGLENLNGVTLGAWGRQEIGADVPPGATKRWDIQMTAPATPGLYKTDWKLKHWGNQFGPYMFIDVTVLAPHTVSTPTTPSGPSSGQTGQSLVYTTAGATDTHGHTVQYRFDWGDSSYSSWSSSASASHSWSSAATYCVKAQARCSVDTSITSSWSGCRNVTISAPHTVSMPSAPSGPSSGETGQTLNYTTGGSTDSQGHAVQYRFDLGDGTYSSWSSSTSVSHSWSSSGTYTVKAQARCSVDTSVTSAWSTGRTVTISPGQACVPANGLSCGGSHLWNNSSYGSTDQVDSYLCSSWDESGPEYTYSFVPSVSGQVDAGLSNMSADLDIFVIDDAGESCSSANCITYGNTTATFDAQAGHTYYLVVDGYYGEVGDYTISVKCLNSSEDVGPLVFYSYTADDDNEYQTQGNGDGIVNCGETVELYVTLHNQGADTAFWVSGIVSASDPYLTWLSNYSLEYGQQFLGGDTETNFVDHLARPEHLAEVDPVTPNGHLLHFDLGITASNGGPWYDSFDVPVTCVTNDPPYTPSSPSPADGATAVSITTDLSWSGGDPDSGDTVTYDVYFEANNSTPDNILCDDVAATACDPGTLAYDTHYYWYVAARDASGQTTTGPVWDFTTQCPAPGTPGSPSPADNATGVSINADLDWADAASATSYDVHFGTSSNPPYVGSTTSSSYAMPSLSFGTPYYWKVVAKNACGESAASPVWSFNTSEARLVFVPLAMRNFVRGSPPPTPTPTPCPAPPIEDLSFNPASPVSVGTTVHVHAKAAWNSCFRAMRLRVDGLAVYELGAPEFTWDWSTSGYAPGDHVIRLEVAALGDNSWLYPSVRQSIYSLT